MRISEAESIVMQALWQRAPQGADEVFAAVGPGQGWQEATVKTLLNRLLRKRAIAAERDGRRYLYRPLLARADYMHAESTSLLERLFDGRVSALVAHFSRSERLSKQEIDELRALIEEIDDGA
ncbi:MAG: BlaI/MecI/CopY family transcriptional regulator [Dokdonella sp.]|uniref:BlaI/MecI/CopY family transcriptional regulator n=1 Tax=Dokdonella sp. TaxID=2291710 RepID=UPI0025BD2E7F|nr:BlaI/MecI/CopY family transcriptional regulator [Dokdonella sp.]MBX3701260.1 BlaI/MecI/CopY family transcriptional regulator [Dokdonella sp.]MCW5578891.1 BlaI/MecI/CopY family transcriptional regulator [Dokdonella sp.]